MPEAMNWSLAWPYLTGAVLLGYLLGSIPFGLLLTRAAGLGDVRAIGSGNIGATNVLRTGNKKVAAATLLLDACKGTVAVLIASYWGPNTALLAALGAFIGHVFPVWLRFKGGKGVATFLGCLMAVDWQIGLVFVVAWLGTAYLSKYSSLSALVASALTPLLLWHWRGDVQAAEMFLLLAVLLLWTHRDNVKRLITGAESKIGQKG